MYLFYVNILTFTQIIRSRVDGLLYRFDHVNIFFFTIFILMGE